MRNPNSPTIPSLSTVRSKKIRQTRKDLQEARSKVTSRKEYASWRLDSDMEALREKHYPHGIDSL